MRRLDELFDWLARRGRHDDVDKVIDRLEQRLAGESEAVALRERDDVWNKETRGRKWMVAVGAALVVLLAVGLPVWLLGGGEEGIEATESVASTVETVPGTEAPPTTEPPTTSVVEQTTFSTTTTTTTTVPAWEPPGFGTGWEIVADNPGGVRPSLASVLPGVGPVFLDSWRPLFGRFDENGEWIAARIDPSDYAYPANVLTATEGLVTYGSVCRGDNDDSCTPAMWFSTDGGFTWDRASAPEGVFRGCVGVAGECYVIMKGAAADPDGHIVVVGFDPVVPPEVSCGFPECYVLTTVAWLSDDGLTWERHEIDLASLLPDDWQGSYDLKDGVVFTGSEWLMHVELIGDAGGTVLLRSSNGASWEPLDAGPSFGSTVLSDLVAGDRGVLAAGGGAVFFSPDLSDWVRTPLAGPGTPMLGTMGDGFVAAIGGGVSETITEIWYSPDGIEWVSVPVDVPGMTYVGSLAGDDTSLWVTGISDNRSLIWHWTEE